MAIQRKNLLEAFRNAGEADPLGTEGSRLRSRVRAEVEAAEAEAQAKTEAATHEPEARVEPPVLPVDKARGAASEPAESERLIPESEIPRVPPIWMPLAAAVSIAFLLGILVGRIGGSEVRAEGDASLAEGSLPNSGFKPRNDLVPRSELIQGDNGEASAPAPGSSSRASALYDPVNRYTLVVATYGRTKEDFAWATHDQLADEGFPVFPPAEVGKDILVLVGAQPEVEDLAQTKEAIRNLTGWDGAKESYKDAYAIRIDRLIDR